MARLTFLLREPLGLEPVRQYGVLSSILKPMLHAHGIYEPMSRIANPIDFRAMVFWNISPLATARIVQRNVERYERRVEGMLWQELSREYRDHHGRWVWQVKEHLV